MKQRPPDWAAWQLAYWSYQDAAAAYDICVETDDRLRRAYVELATAGPVFGEVYEAPQALVASGGVLPRDGRWITGEKSPA